MTEQARRTRAATRISRARLGDVRLWGGMALIALAVVVGALVVGRGEDTVQAWRATRDLSAGTVLPIDGLPDGIEAVRVARAVAGDRYVLPAAGGTLRWPVSAGELVPQSAWAAPTGVPTRLVTIPVDPLHAPVGLASGATVDAWVTAASQGTAVSAPRLVLAGALVADVADEGLGLAGELGVVLEVPESEAGAVIAAARSGVIDLVAVPASSQESVL